MKKELQSAIKDANRCNPVDEVVKKLLRTQSKSCVRAKMKLDEIELHEKKHN